MLQVKLAEKIQCLALAAGANSGRRGQVEEWIALAAKERALVSGRHKARRPVGRAADRSATRVGHDHKTGQAIVECPQTVAEPSSHAGFADLHAAGVHL